MPSNTSPKPEKIIVLIGAGHSHVAVLRSFGMRPERGVRLILIARDLHAPYSGMLPGLIAGHYTYEETHVDVLPLARFAGAHVYHDEVTGIDLINRRVHCRNRPRVPYDLLSINVGSRPASADVPGAAEYALPVKPVERFLEGWQDIQKRAGESTGEFRIITVGGGAGGIELTLTMHHQLTHNGVQQKSSPSMGEDLEPSLTLPKGGGEASTPKTQPNRITFRVITASNDILETHNPGVRKRMRRVLNERGIALDTASRVTNVEQNAVILENDTHHEYDALVWVTNAGAAPWFAESGLATDDEGFIAVGETLQSTSHPAVFAGGDAASMIESPRPKSGVFAVRQGPYLAENLRRAARGEALRRFSPQTKFLSLISTGDKNAIASRGSWSAEGPRIWTLKNWIDRRWMRKYHDLPEMDASAMNDSNAEDAMRCGGCGCKIGSDLLTDVLRELDTGNGAFIGLDAADDAAVFEWPADSLVVQSVDYFKTFVDDPYIFGQITANHALNDLFAMNAAPHSALTNVALPVAGDVYTKHLLHDVLAGAVHVLREHGAVLGGGHTVEGADFAFGLTVNGRAKHDTILRKGGLKPGDRLILTKPLGTGVLFAGAMRGEAKGRWIERAIETMLQSNAEAAQILAEHGATACTDVTGFGLVGHLVEMLEASNASAELNLDAITALDGVIELFNAGVASTLQPKNQSAERYIANRGDYRNDPRYPLLFDPQTAGGLLAGIPEAKFQDCLARLKEVGFRFAETVGTVSEQTDAQSRIVLR